MIVSGAVESTYVVTAAPVVATSANAPVTPVPLSTENPAASGALLTHVKLGWAAGASACQASIVRNRIAAAATRWGDLLNELSARLLQAVFAVTAPRRLCVRSATLLPYPGTPGI